MKRKSLIMIALTFGLALPVLTAAASPQQPARAQVPLGIDASVLQAPTNGPVVATGKLTDSQGRGVTGTVAVLAWPNEAFNRTLRVGDRVTTPTVGWAPAGTDGSFSIRVDPTRVGVDYLRPDGTANLDAVGWTQASQGSWAFSAQIRAPAVAHGVQTSPALAAARLVIKTEQRLSPGRDVRAKLGTGAAPAKPDFNCYWVLISTYDTWSIIGQTMPWGPDLGWMMSQSSQSMTVGVAASSSGTYGSWSASGTSSVSSGVSFTWAANTNYRNYQVSLRYGKYKYSCPGGPYREWAIYPTGGYTTSYVSYPYYSYCYTVSAGVWARSASNGNHFNASGGVLIGGLLGINLSIDSNYDSSHVLYYQLMDNGTVCGDNNVPAYASNVTTSR
jgi:hypothetical protein